MHDIPPDYQSLKALNLNLDLTRGRPAPEFLDLAAGLETRLPDNLHLAGTDLRNYAGFPGLPAARALGGELLDAPADSVLVCGNSSLAGLFQVICAAWFQGLNSQAPWAQRQRTACICPVPGYDRHFMMLKTLGIGALAVRLTGEGADVAQMEELLQDGDVRALLMVPRHSNPTGDVWSADTLERTMRLAAAAPEDFLLLVDNAYAIHDFAPTAPQPSIYRLAEQHGVLDRLFLFGSMSKIGYAGSGLAFTACSEKNRQQLVSLLAGLSLGPSALDQARHSLFFKDLAGIRTHFDKIAPLLKRRFDIAEQALAPLLARNDVEYHRPAGGYFLSLNLPVGCARRTVELAAEAGVKISPAGATFPDGIDPDDSNIRLAPTSPALDQLETAMQTVAASALEAIRQKGEQQG